MEVFFLLERGAGGRVGVGFIDKQSLQLPEFINGSITFFNQKNT
jgi:hypothetical protein